MSKTKKVIEVIGIILIIGISLDVLSTLIGLQLGLQEANKYVIPYIEDFGSIGGVLLVGWALISNVILIVYFINNQLKKEYKKLTFMVWITLIPIFIIAIIARYIVVMMNILNILNLFV